MLTDNEIKSQWLNNNIPFTATDQAERQELEDEKRAKKIRNAQTEALYERKKQWHVMRQVIKSLGGSLRESKEQCAAQEIAAERMEKKNKALEDEQLSLTTAVTKYKEEKHHLRLQIDGLEKDIMLAKLGKVKDTEEESKATVDLQSARETITVLNNKREAHEKTISDLRYKLAAAEQKLGVADAMTNSLNDKLATAEQELKDAETTISNLNDKLTSLHQK